MLTRKQHELIRFIQVKLEETGISPSFKVILRPISPYLPMCANCRQSSSRSGYMWVLSMV